MQDFALQDDKLVVLDPGSLYFKCGLAGEPRPRVIVSNIFATPSEILDSGFSFGGISKSEMKPFWDMRKIDSNALFETFLVALRYIFTRGLGFSLQEAKVVIIEKGAMQKGVKDALSRALVRLKAS